jgi:hypothetical protein
MIAYYVLLFWIPIGAIFALFCKCCNFGGSNLDSLKDMMFNINLDNSPTVTQEVEPTADAASKRNGIEL